MHRAFQSLFVDPVDHSPLTFTGETPDGRWYNGQLRAANGRVWAVREGIPHFCAEEHGDHWDEDTVRRWLNDGTYANSWQTGAQELLEVDSGLGAAAREVAERGCPVVDIASGPGGGFMPSILAHNPAAVVLATDASAPLLHGWRMFLHHNGAAPNHSLAACNAMALPLAAGSVEAMTSVIGFSSVHGNGMVTALREAARVLAPDGLLYAAEGRHDPAGIAALCDRLGWQLEARFGADWIRPLPELFTEAGLRVLSEEPWFRRAMREDDNDWSAKANQLGIEIWWTVNVWRLARA